MENLLLGENNIFNNRELHINYVEPENIGVNDSVKQVNVPVNDKKFPVKGKKFLVNNEKFPVKGKKFLVNNEKFPVKGKKFLVNNEKFPVIGLEIMKFMDNNPNITIIELSKQLNISDRAIKNNINKLKNAGIISRVGSDKTGNWEIIKKGDNDE